MFLLQQCLCKNTEERKMQSDVKIQSGRSPRAHLQRRLYKEQRLAMKLSRQLEACCHPQLTQLSVLLGTASRFSILKKRKQR